MEGNIIKKCNRCKKDLPITNFNRKKSGDYNKGCISCLEKEKQKAMKNKCEHKRQRNNCIDCNGASICEHQRIRNTCKDCGGTSICEHNRQRSQCIDCGGASICVHQKKRSQCIDCGGASICEHNRQRNNCKDCNDPIPITIKNMIKGSKENDKKYNRYDQTNFIDYCFVKNLIDDSENKCFYCHCELQYQEFTGNLATIERLDNTIGHNRGNCVIACRTCNYSRVGDKN